MPSSPVSLCRDCSSRAVANGYCATHQEKNNAEEHRRLFDRYRADDFVRSLYRSTRWTKGTRLIVLRRDQLCCECGHRASTDCDHDPLEARQIVEQFGTDAFYDPNRCQGLCHDCHSQKTSITTGFAKRKKAE
jgi:5-methylcytosine-specific restriction endonuclease McrA